MESNINKNNYLYSEIRVIINIILSFISIPFIIKYIGYSTYGLWALLSSLIPLIGLIDLGLSTNLTRVIAQYDVKNEKKRIFEALYNTFIFYIIVSSVAILLLITFKYYVFIRYFPVLSKVQNIDNIYYSILFISFLNLFQVALNNVILGFKRLDLILKINLINNLVYYLLLFICIFHNYKIYSFILSLLISLIITIFLELFVVYSKIKGTYFEIKKINISYIIQSIKYGSQITFVNIASTLFFQSTKFIISKDYGLEFTAFYEISLKIINQIKVIPLAILEPLLPYSSVFQKKSGNIKKLYLDNFKYFIILLFPIFISIIILSPILIKIWLGKDNYSLINTIKLLCLVQIVNLITGPAITLLNGQGKPKYGMYSSFILIISNFIFVILLSKYLGYYGILLGMLIAVSISSLFFFYLFHRDIKIKITKILNLLYIPLLISIIMPQIILILYTKYNNVLLLIIYNMIAIILYIFVLLKFQYFDLNFIKDKFKIIKRL